MCGIPKLKSIPLHLLPHVCKLNGYEQNIYTKKIYGHSHMLVIYTINKIISRCVYHLYRAKSSAHSVVFHPIQAVSTNFLYQSIN